MFNDVREYLDRLEKEGHLQRISAEVDWDRELGAITRLVCERRQPAPLFENIKGYPGHRVAGVLMGPSAPSLHARVAIALGEDPHTHPLDLIERVREKFETPVPPVVVGRDTAPCKEVIQPGADVDLLSLPVPWIKSVDGGRYIGTWDIVVTKDPDSDWTNWGTYRCMVHDDKSFASLFIPHDQHGGDMLKRYAELGRPMPVALVMGADPASHLASITPFPSHVSEVDMAGALRGEPVPLVKCETSDLLVPANAEIVIEAEIHPGERVPEGPFGEYTGHAAHQGMSPLARVTCVTHRKDPILTVANVSKPWDDGATPGSVVVSAVVKNELLDAGLPVKSLYIPAPQNVPVISVEPRPGLAEEIFQVLASRHRMFYTGAVLVDDDVDITNGDDVWWALANRLHPDGFKVISDVVNGNPLIPYLTPTERERGRISVWLADATFPADWPKEYREAHTQVVDFAHGWTPDIQEQVLRRWAEYGYA